jgi:hypothetical protein
MAVLVDHEIRRIIDLVDDAAETERIRERASAIAWAFVHRTETYVAGLPTDAPVYKFVCQIPEGQIDDQFAPAVNRDIMPSPALPTGTTGSPVSTPSPLCPRGR